MKTTPKTAEPIDPAEVVIPKPEDVSPAYTAALQSLLALQMRRDALESEVNELLSISSTRSNASGFEAEVQALLGNDTEKSARSAITSAQDRLAGAYRDRRLLNEAIDRRKREVDTERHKASLLICDQLAPVHRAVVADMLSALLNVHAAHLRYHALMGQLDQAGVSRGSLRPMFPTMLGDPTEDSSRLAFYFRDAAEGGFLPPAEVPPSLRYTHSRASLEDWIKYIESRTPEGEARAKRERDATTAATRARRLSKVVGDDAAWA